MYGFRDAAAADLPWMARGAFEAAWASLAPAERAQTAPAVVAEVAWQQLQEFLTGGRSVAIVAMAGWEPAGFVVGAVGPDTTTEEPHGHVLTVWVAPAHRRRGLARKLLALAESRFDGLGLRKVKVWTPVYNRAGVSLACASGYAPEGLIGLKRLPPWPVMHLSDTVT